GRAPSCTGGSTFRRRPPLATVDLGKALVAKATCDRLERLDLDEPPRPPARHDTAFFWSGWPESPLASYVPRPVAPVRPPSRRTPTSVGPAVRAGSLTRTSAGRSRRHQPDPA